MVVILATGILQSPGCVLRLLQVRIAACGQLVALGAVLGPEAAKQALLPELAELLEDEEVQVRLSLQDCKHVAHKVPYDCGTLIPQFCRVLR